MYSTQFEYCKVYYYKYSIIKMIYNNSLVQVSSTMKRMKRTKQLLTGGQKTTQLKAISTLPWQQWPTRCLAPTRQRPYYCKGN